jgi:hypothetical protein
VLTIWSNGRGSLCNGLTRRDFLSVGTLALGGISLAGLLRHQAPAAERKRTPKSVIMVYLPGGPSHIDLYDMKPDAPWRFAASSSTRGPMSPASTSAN